MCRIMCLPSKYIFINATCVYSQLLHYFCPCAVVKQQVKEHLQSKGKFLIAVFMSFIISFTIRLPICAHKQMLFNCVRVYL